jgi:hypothetical protein
MDCFSNMTDQLQDISEEIEDHTWSYDDDASYHLDFDGVDGCDYDDAPSPTIVSANSFSSSEDHRDDSTGIMLSASSWGDDSGLTRVSDFEESYNPKVEEAKMAPVPPEPLSPPTSTGPHRLEDNELVKATFPQDSHPELPYIPSSWWYDNTGVTIVSSGQGVDDFNEGRFLETEDVKMAPVPPQPFSPPTTACHLRLDDNELVKATFPPDSHPQLPYHDLTWWSENTEVTVVSPGPKEDEEAVHLPPPLNHRRVTPPRVVFRKRLEALRPPLPLEQAVVTPPRPKTRKRAPKRAPRKKEPKMKQYVTKTSFDVLLGTSTVLFSCNRPMSKISHVCSIHVISCQYRTRRLQQPPQRK